MDIKLSDHFTLKKLIRFVMPSVIMMVFTSIYGVVDGYFVSNYTGKTPFAAINLVWPFIMIIGTIGFMVGTGGTALVSKTLGEGDKKKANEIFSLLVYFVIGFGVVAAVLSIIFIKQVCIKLGAEGDMLPYAEIYGKIVVGAMPFFMLQNVFQSLLVTAERPKLGLAVTVVAGALNMLLDFLLVGVFNFGVTGAAVATAVSEVAGGGIPLIYFFVNKTSPLRLCKTHFDSKALFKTFTNGASEFMTNISMSLVNIVYNYVLLRAYGENGVAAYGVIMYVSFVFVSIFIGYSMGVAPIIGYSYGAENHSELKNIFKKSLTFLAVGGVIMAASAIALSRPLAHIYTGYDKELFELTTLAFMLFSTHFLFAGFNIFSSAFFTALNNGAVSAAISFLRTMVFEISWVLILPKLFGINAIWLAMTASEICTLAVSAFFLINNKKRYHYI